MKKIFKVFNDKESSPEEIFFKLEGSEYNKISLVACYSNGIKVPEGHILSITADGELRLSSSVTEGLGLKLDMNHKIRIEE